MSAPTTIIVWVCAQPGCEYWRQDGSTRRHATPDPNDPNGRMVTHVLVPMTYGKPRPMRSQHQ